MHSSARSYSISLTLLSLEELRGCVQGANYSGSHRDSSHSPLPLLAEPASAAAPGPELTLIRLLEQHSRYRGVRNTASPTPAPSALHSSALTPHSPISGCYHPDQEPSLPQAASDCVPRKTQPKNNHPSAAGPVRCCCCVGADAREQLSRGLGFIFNL